MANQVKICRFLYYWCNNLKKKITQNEKSGAESGKLKKFPPQNFFQKSKVDSDRVVYPLNFSTVKFRLSGLSGLFVIFGVFQSL